MTEDDILYERGGYWVTAAAFAHSSGYRIWQNAGPHRRLAVETIGYAGDKGLTMAKERIAWRLTGEGMKSVIDAEVERVRREVCNRHNFAWTEDDTALFRAAFNRLADAVRAALIARQGEY